MVLAIVLQQVVYMYLVIIGFSINSHLKDPVYEYPSLHIFRIIALVLGTMGLILIFCILLAVCISLFQMKEDKDRRIGIS